MADKGLIHGEFTIRTHHLMFNRLNAIQDLRKIFKDQSDNAPALFKQLSEDIQRGNVESVQEDVEKEEKLQKHDFAAVADVEEIAVKNIYTDVSDHLGAIIKTDYKTPAVKKKVMSTVQGTCKALVGVLDKIRAMWVNLKSDRIRMQNLRIYDEEGNEINKARKDIRNVITFSNNLGKVAGDLVDEKLNDDKKLNDLLTKFKIDIAGITKLILEFHQNLILIVRHLHKQDEKFFAQIQGLQTEGFPSDDLKKDLEAKARIAAEEKETEDLGEERSVFLFRLCKQRYQEASQKAA